MAKVPLVEVSVNVKRREPVKEFSPEWSVDLNRACALWKVTIRKDGSFIDAGIRFGQHQHAVEVAELLGDAFVVPNFLL